MKKFCNKLVPVPKLLVFFILLLLVFFLCCLYSSINIFDFIYVQEIKKENIKKEKDFIIVNIPVKSSYLIRINGNYDGELPVVCKTIFNNHKISQFRIDQTKFRNEIIIDENIINNGKNLFKIVSDNDSVISLKNIEVNIKNFRGYNSGFPKLIVLFKSSKSLINDISITGGFIPAHARNIYLFLTLLILVLILFFILRPIFSRPGIIFFCIIPVSLISVITILTDLFFKYYIVWDILDILTINFLPFLLTVVFLNKGKITNFINLLQKHQYNEIVKYLFVFLLIVLPKIICFQTYLVEWDGAEYAWDIKYDVLPHGPYPIYIWLGKFLSLFFTPDIALSVLAVTISSLGSLSLFLIIKKLYQNDFLALIVTTTFNYLPVVINYSVIQDTYPIQIGLLLLSMLGIVLIRSYSMFFSGVFCGMALGTHNSTICIVPFLLYFLFKKSSKKSFILLWFTGLLISFGSSLIWTFFQYNKIFQTFSSTMKQWLIYYTKAQIPAFDWRKITLFAYFDKNSYITILNYLSETISVLVLILAGFYIIVALLNKKIDKSIFVLAIWFLPYFLLYDVSNKGVFVKPAIHFVQYAVPISVFASFGICYLFSFIFQKFRYQLLLKSLFIIFSIWLAFNLNMGRITYLYNQREYLRKENEPYKLIDKYFPKDCFVIATKTPMVNIYYANRRPIFGYKDPLPPTVYVSKLGIWDVNRWQGFDKKSFDAFIRKNLVITLDKDRIMFENKPTFYMILQGYSMYKY